MAISTAICYPYAVTENMEILSETEMRERIEFARQQGKRIITTNGCFDLLHAGHVEFLKCAKALGDLLVIGLNSDASVTQLKGAGRPLIPERDRAMLLTALRCVDYVVVFDELIATQWLEVIRPDIHCKAGDYSRDSLPETAVVQAYGGEVHILPFQAGISTSTIVARITNSSSVDEGDSTGMSTAQVMQMLLAGSNVVRQTAYRLADQIEQVAAHMTMALKHGHKMLICGNGGSAADAQHFAAELVGRYQRERTAWPALALTTDSSALTSIANDYGFDQVFARQVAGLGLPGDILVVISTSGNSKNLLAAVATAKQLGITSLALTGEGPSALTHACDHVLSVPSRETPLIQQAHIAIIHCLCELIERTLCEEPA